MIKLTEMIEKAIELLNVDSRVMGGFKAQSLKDSTDTPVAPSSANVILALFEYNKLEKTESDISDLIALKLENNAWCRNERASNWATCKAIYTLFKIKGNQLAFIKESIKYLINNQNDDGGWGYLKSNPSRPFYTFYVIEALTLILDFLTSNDELTSDDELIKEMIEKSLQKSSTFLINCKIKKSKYWPKRINETEKCAASTFFALCSLKYLSKYNFFPIKDFNNYFKSTKDFITQSFSNEENWKNYEFQEPGPDFIINILPPVKIREIIFLFEDPFNPLICNLLNWIQKKFIKYKDNSGGWGKPNEKAPYTWITAKILVGIKYLTESLLDNINYIKFKSDTTIKIKESRKILKNLINKTKWPEYTIYIFILILLPLFFIVLIMVLPSEILLKIAGTISIWGAISILTLIFHFTKHNPIKNFFNKWRNDLEKLISEE